MNERKKERMNERMNERKKERMNERKRERKKYGKKEKKATKQLRTSNESHCQRMQMQYFYAQPPDKLNLRLWLVEGD